MGESLAAGKKKNQDVGSFTRKMQHAAIGIQWELLEQL